MAYYMRSNNASSHGNYMMSNSSMQGCYLMHSAKGSEWKKGHKYIDKRLIGGVWKYLYELPKEYLKNGREGAKKVAESADKDISAGYKATKQNVSSAAKNVGENIQKRHNYAVNEMKKTAEKAVDTVKDTAQKATKAAKDFKDYSDKIDTKEARAKETANETKPGYYYDNDWSKINSKLSRTEETSRRMAEASRQKDKAEADKIKAEKELNEMNDRWHNGGVVNQKEIQDAKDRISKAEQDIKKAEAAFKNAEAAHDRELRRREDALRAEKEAEEEKESVKYKASKALNDIIDGADNISAQGAQWLKNQLESGNKWAMNTLAAIEEKSTSAVATGNAFLQNLLGKNKQQTSRSSGSSSGRNYSGTGNKAQRREAVAGGPVSDNDYRRRPKR